MIGWLYILELYSSNSHSTSLGQDLRAYNTRNILEAEGSTEEWSLQVCLKETLLAFFFLLEKMLEINVWPHQISLKF